MANRVFVLGRHVDGNRQVLVVDDAFEYTVDADTIVEYSDASVAFPYSE
jgi:hypothetical protein